jgi:hypothetical protein
MRDSYTNPSMYKSSRIKKNRVILKNKSSETNPWNESLRFGVTHPDLRVHQPGFIRFRDSQILIFKDSFCAIVLKICKDSWGFVGFVKTSRIFWKWLDLWSTTRNKSFQVRICDPRYKTNLDLWSTSRYKSLI